MSKKIPVLNSPWGRDYERPSDCERWIRQGHAELIDGALSFTQAFFESQRRTMLEYDPIGTDDGKARRWTNRPSGNSSVPPQAAVTIEGQPRQLLDAVKLDNGEIRRGLIVKSAGGIDVKQLVLVDHVGTGRGVTKKADKLIRRTGHPGARSVVAA